MQRGLTYPQCNAYGKLNGVLALGAAGCGEVWSEVLLREAVPQWRHHGGGK